MSWVKRNAPPRAESGWAWQVRRAFIYRRDGGLCGHCGVLVPEDKFEVDHILGRSAGGSDFDNNNLVTSCRPCNQRKAQRQSAAALGLKVKRAPEKHPGAVA